MKNSNGMIAGLLTVVLLVGGAAGWLLASYTGEPAGNYGNEMKLEYRTNYADGGANTVERNGDHEDSPYFYHVDFYNAKSGDGLYILPRFKTIQQTSWWSCGVGYTDKPLFSKIRNASMVRTERGKYSAQGKKGLKVSMRMYD